MNIKLTGIALLCLATSLAHAEDAPLFRLASAGAGQPGMIFQEIERSENASIVEATQSGGSVAAKSMFLLRGSCALMKERGKQAFRVEQLSRQPIRFSVRFVAAEPAAGEKVGQPLDEGGVISAARCDSFQSVMGW
jgi:hypothetical protein